MPESYRGPTTAHDLDYLEEIVRSCNNVLKNWDPNKTDMADRKSLLNTMLVKGIRRMLSTGSRSHTWRRAFGSEKPFINYDDERRVVTKIVFPSSSYWQSIADHVKYTDIAAEAKPVTVISSPDKVTFESIERIKF